MIKIMNKEYEAIMNIPINIGKLGQSTGLFAQFVSTTISSTVSASVSSNNSETTLINKLVSLTANRESLKSKSTFERLMKSTESFEMLEEPEKTAKKSDDSSFEIIEKQKSSSGISEFEKIGSVLPRTTEILNVISEMDELMEELKDLEVEEKVPEDTVELKFKFTKPNKLKTTKVRDATCHTFFIVKDKGMKINWQKPLVQKSQISTQI
jgi:hypothetical protein